MIDAIDAVRVKGDSVGGIVTCIARNVPKVCFIHLIISCIKFQRFCFRFEVRLLVLTIGYCFLGRGWALQCSTNSKPSWQKRLCLCQLPKALRSGVVSLVHYKKVPSITTNSMLMTKATCEHEQTDLEASKGGYLTERL